MRSKEPFDLSASKQKQWKAFVKAKDGDIDGVFAPMLKYLLESMVEDELDNHLQESKGGDDPNRRNGKPRTTLRNLQSGEFELEGTRGRNGTFSLRSSPSTS